MYEDGLSSIPHGAPTALNCLVYGEGASLLDKVLIRQTDDLCMTERRRQNNVICVGRGKRGTGQILHLLHDIHNLRVCVVGINRPRLGRGGGDKRREDGCILEGRQDLGLTCHSTVMVIPLPVFPVLPALLVWLATHHHPSAHPTSL